MSVVNEYGENKRDLFSIIVPSVCESRDQKSECEVSSASMSGKRVDLRLSCGRLGGGKRTGEANGRRNGRGLGQLVVLLRVRQMSQGSGGESVSDQVAVVTFSYSECWQRPDSDSDKSLAVGGKDPAKVRTVATTRNQSRFILEFYYLRC